MAKIRQANLTKPVTYIVNGVEVIIPQDTLVQVDTQDGYIEWNGTFLDIFKDEYRLVVISKE